MLRKIAKELRKRKRVARPEDVFIIGPDGKRKRKPVGDPRLRASDVFIIGPDGKRKRKPAVPKMGNQLRDYVQKNPGRMTSRLLKLARATKPTGRLNIDDLMNVKASGVLAGTGFGKKTQSKGPAGRVMKKKRGGSIKKKSVKKKK